MLFNKRFIFQNTNQQTSNQSQERERQNSEKIDQSESFDPRLAMKEIADASKQKAYSKLQNALEIPKNLTLKSEQPTFNKGTGDQLQSGNLEEETKAENTNQQ